MVLWNTIALLTPYFESSSSSHFLFIHHPLNTRRPRHLTSGVTTVGGKEMVSCIPVYPDIVQMPCLGMPDPAADELSFRPKKYWRASSLGLELLLDYTIDHLYSIPNTFPSPSTRSSIHSHHDAAYSAPPIRPLIHRATPRAPRSSSSTTHLWKLVKTSYSHSSAPTRPTNIASVRCLPFYCKNIRNNKDNGGRHKSRDRCLRRGPRTQ
jgi:hypothetical protein